MQTDLDALSSKIEASVDRIEQAVLSIKEQPNQVMQFIDSNWKGIIVVVAVLAGANATVVELLGKVLT